MRYYQQNKLADFAAASSNACFGSFVPLHTSDYDGKCIGVFPETLVSRVCPLQVESLISSGCNREWNYSHGLRMVLLLLVSG
jgi:hypothetical protein